MTVADCGKPMASRVEENLNSCAPMLIERRYKAFHLRQK
jgi:hypothetical protein